MRTELLVQDKDVRASTRRGTLSVVMWVFGLSTTLLLVGLWGRAVTVDETTVAESAKAVVDAEIAQDRIYDWIGDAITETQNVGNDTASAVISELRNRPELTTAIDDIVEGFVAALFAPEGRSTVVDLQSAIAPVLPIVVGELSEHDVAVDEGLLEGALGEAPAIELDTGEAAGVAAVVRDARTLVSRVVLFAALVMLLAGSAAIALAEKRFAMVRTLSIRVLLSAISFAVLFRLGSWALDPDGGGTPVANGGSIILGSNSHVFLFIALGAAVVGTAGGWVAWKRQRVRPAPVVALTDTTEDDTRELISV
jgi:hypothetical protein